MIKTKQTKLTSRRCSLYGRALALHAKGTGFDSPNFHFYYMLHTFTMEFSLSLGVWEILKSFAFSQLLRLPYPQISFSYTFAASYYDATTQLGGTNVSTHHPADLKSFTRVLAITKWIQFKEKKPIILLKRTIKCI